MLRLAVIAVCLVAGVGQAKDHGHSHAHEHGVAKLDLAVEGKEARMRFETPAEGIFGFEHRPRTEAQKETVAKETDKLRREAPGFVKFPAALSCKGEVTSLDAFQDEGQGKDHDDHSEVVVEVRYQCAKEIAGSVLSFAVTKHFPRIKRVKVQGLSEKRQGGLTLKSDAGTLEL